MTGGAFDTTVWRVVGDPLVAGEPAGPLAGETVAVKDLYAVAGHAVGAGNPTWLESAPVEAEHAAVVTALLEAGASVAGIARTDEFAYSLAGTNHHYGTAPNPAAPGRIPGGSSCGPASAVALGHATIGLGTDTAGSVRVPAAYQGLFGIRTTHDALPRGGLMPLAPTFDTVGWLTRDPDLLLRVGEALLPRPREDGSDDLVVAPELLLLAEPDVREAIAAWLPPTAAVEWPVDVLPSWLAAFQTWQAWEAWQAHGWWLAQRMDVLGPDVRSRFERARSVTSAEADTAAEVVLRARSDIRELVGRAVLVLPSAPTVAPELGPGLADRLLEVRQATLSLTCLAGLGGLPAVNVPLRTRHGLPCGVSLLAAPGRDLDLLRMARDLW